MPTATTGPGCPCAVSGWSDLPADLLAGILGRLELPEALAFAAVCAWWRATAATACLLLHPAPWLVCRPKLAYPRPLWMLRCGWLDHPVSSEFRNLLNPDKAYRVSFPQGRSLHCCGASHGWLIASDELSNLVLYSPFTSALIPLPPATDFASVKAVYGGEGGRITGYRFEGCRKFFGVRYLGKIFYQKAVLLSSPSQGGGYIAMIIHRLGDRLSFARAGEGCWHLASTIYRSTHGIYADCVYHSGRFYTVRMNGSLEAWDLEPDNAKKESIIGQKDGCGATLTRFLASTPWGDLLQIRPIRAPRGEEYPKCVKVEIDRVDLERRSRQALCPATALRGHAVFLGQNHSACLPIDKFPELRPNCIYFTIPRLGQNRFFRIMRHGWRGVRTYDLENRTLEDACPCSGRDYAKEAANEIWITPNL